jgi:predicted PurR-regulated permease PerM
MFLLLLVVMVALIIPVIGSTSISAIDGVTKMRSGLKSTLLNPIGSVRESPAKIKKVVNDTSGVFKNASKSIISSLKKRVR